MDKTQTINVAYDRVSLLLQFSACQCMCSYDHEIMQLPDTGGMPCVYQTSQRNWATIKVLYRYLRWWLLVGVNRDWDLLLRVTERYLGAHSVKQHHNKPCKHSD